MSPNCNCCIYYHYEFHLIWSNKHFCMSVCLSVQIYCLMIKVCVEYDC